MIALLLALLFPAAAFAVDVPAVVERVSDADTVYVRGQAGAQFVHPDGTAIFVPTSKEIGVRVKGIDAPEIRGRCDRERLKAQEGKRFVERLLPPGTVVRLRGVTGNVYSGRVDAEVVLPDGRNLAEVLLWHPERLVVPSSTKRTEDWCAQ
jgi:endonuclease YncB( thermonuclease family)